MSTPTDIVSCEGLAIGHGRKVIMDRLSFALPAGKILAIVGPSGCGKSTLAFAISNLHGAPALISEGEILFDNRDVLKMSPKALRKFRWNEASMVFQSAMNALNPVITIGAQITDVILAHKKVGFGEAWERGEALLETVGIHCSRMTSYPHQLSGGMRQRVVIAIALALRPRLIIMDEPTTALDVVVEREIMDELYALKKEFGFSILFISHDLSLMGEIADRIGISKQNSVIDFSVLENCVRETLDESAERRMAVVHPIKLVITNLPVDHVEMLSMANHPKNDDCGKRQVPFSNELWIDAEDFMETPVPGYHRLTRGADVRLRGVGIVTCDEVVSTGGTGLTGRDVTPEALSMIAGARDIPGFGELFRWLSFKSIGTSTVQSRACAVVARGTYIFALPGSNGAVKDGWDQILVHQLDNRHRPCNFVELMPRLSER